MSNEEKKGPLVVDRVYVGDKIQSPITWGLFHNHEIRIPFLNNQYFMESRRVFFRGSPAASSIFSCRGEGM